MNSFAVCSRDCRKARSHDSLDQTRTGTIVWTERTTSRSFCDKMLECRDVFTGSRTRLKIVGLERSSYEPLTHWGNVERRFQSEGFRLDHVTSLDCSCAVNNRTIIARLIALYNALPNLQDVDLTNLGASFQRVAGDFCRYCPSLTKVIWTGCHGSAFLQCGTDFLHATNLSHLYIDGARFSLHEMLPDGNIVGANYFTDSYLLKKCKSLERLSLKAATLAGRIDVPLPQDVLIKMVRRHPSLRWLRSDLTEDNVAMLKQERPEITFVSE